MYCNQCGTEISDQAKFCSGCGRVVDTTQPMTKPPRNMATHVNILAWLFVASAILYAMAACVLFVAPRILQQLPIPTPPEVPIDILHLVTSLSGVLGLAILMVAVGTAAAGVGLMQYQSWGRPLALVMSGINLLKLPFGTALGIYGFWVLLSERGREHYDRQSAIAEGRAITHA
jgi:hypothetical protein